MNLVKGKSQVTSYRRNNRNHAFGARNVRVLPKGISRSTSFTNLDRLKCAGLSVVSISRSNDTLLILMKGPSVDGGPMNVSPLKTCTRCFRPFVFHNGNFLPHNCLQIG